PPPAHHQLLQHRRRNRVVSRVMPVIPVPALEVPPGNQPAGSGPKLQVEGMPDKPIPHLEPRQQPTPTLRRLPHTPPFHCPIFHGLYLSTARRGAGPACGL